MQLAGGHRTVQSLLLPTPAPCPAAGVEPRGPVINKHTSLQALFVWGPERRSCSRRWHCSGVTPVIAIRTSVVTYCRWLLDFGSTLVVTVPASQGRGLRLTEVRCQDHRRGTNQWQDGTNTQGLTFHPALFALSLSIATCSPGSPTWKVSPPGRNDSQWLLGRGQGLTNPAQQILTPCARHQLAPLGTITSGLLGVGQLRCWLPSRKGSVWFGERVPAS